VDLGEAGVVRREILHHPGAVTVLALDHEDRVLMIRQYRHPTGMELWELPAGLLDIAGEPPLLAAQRELAEEGDLRAERWDLLIDWFNSPGGSDETVRLFLARDVHPVADHERHERTDEELGMPTRWVPLEEARDAVLAGRVHNPGSVIGILAACLSRDLGWSTLRPPDSPWPEHPAFR
jgi:8-oxo-dGTP pyrophosphatase MutT (NUDIX family)